MKIADFNPQRNINNNIGFNRGDNAECAHPFLAFEPLMSVPINTLKAYFSPALTKGYREIGQYNTPYAEASKMYELSNGHRVFIFQKKGPVIIKTGIKTNDKISKDTKHLLEHIIYNNNQKVGNQTFIDLRKELALKRYADSNTQRSTFSLEYSFDNPEAIEKVINAQAELLFNADIEKFFEKEKNIITAEEILNNRQDDFDFLSSDEAKNYYQKTFQNHNMATVIESPLPVEKVIDIFSRAFKKTDDKKFSPSSLEISPNLEKESFDKFKKMISFEDNLPPKTKAQKICKLLLNNPSKLTDWTLLYILDYGKPYILDYHKKLEEIDNTILQKTSFKGNLAALDTKDIQEYRYPNNLTLTLDSGSPYDEMSRFKYLFKLDIPMVTKPGANEIFNQMLLLNILDLEKSEEADPDIVAATNNHFFNIEVMCLPERTFKAIDKIKSTITNLNLSEKNFETAKVLLKDAARFSLAQKTIETIPDKMLDAEEYEANGKIPQYTPYEEASKLYDNITLDDIRQIYNHFLTNAHASVVAAVPRKLGEGNNKEKLLSLIGANLPVFKPSKEIFQNEEINVPISLPDKTHVITQINNSENSVVTLGYKIPLTNNFKEDIGIKILETIIGGEDYSRLNTILRENDNLVYSTDSLLREDLLTHKKLALIANVPVLEGKYNNLQKVCNRFNEIINDLRTKPVDEKELNTAKLTVKSYISNNEPVPSSRYFQLQKLGLTNLKNSYNYIDSITADDIQRLANKYLNNGLWCIETNESSYKYNCEYLKNLENFN